MAGRAATPGPIDTHVHFSEAAALFAVDLSDIAITKMDDVVARVAAQVARTKPGEWVTGNGWDEGKLAERRNISDAAPEKVSPHHPAQPKATPGPPAAAPRHALTATGAGHRPPAPPPGQGRPGLAAGTEHAMAQAVDVAVQRLVVGVTVGQAVGFTTQSVEELVEAADKAMYRRKRGRSAVGPVVD